MLCEKCGKMNDSKSVKCGFCGSDMPKRSGCGGFSDILSYENLNTAKPITPPVTPNLVDPVEVKKLHARFENMKRSNRILSIMSLCSIALAVVAVVISVIVIFCGVDMEDVEKHLLNAKMNGKTLIELADDYSKDKKELETLLAEYNALKSDYSELKAELESKEIIKPDETAEEQSIDDSSTDKEKSEEVKDGDVDNSSENVESVVEDISDELNDRIEILKK